MSYFLNEENEVKLSEFLVRENTKICTEQLKGDDVPDQFRDLIKRTLDSGSPVPFFDPKYGYYSVSFTPCEGGTRIYAHHHLSNTSECIHDPANVTVIVDDSEEESDGEDTHLETENESIQSSIEDLRHDPHSDESESIGSIPVSDDGLTGHVDINE